MFTRLSNGRERPARPYPPELLHHGPTRRTFLLALLGGVTSHRGLTAAGPGRGKPPEGGPYHLERLEVVTEEAATGDGGNAWGGHQTRIVRTPAGRLYTAYTVAGAGDTARGWRLAERTDIGWRVVADGPAGREPVNVLAGPKDQVHVFGWPDGRPRQWTVTAGGGKPTREAVVPGDWVRGHWPYGAAGVNPTTGDLCLLQSNGDKPGEMRWAYFAAGTGKWTFHVLPLAYRHCYAYVFPGAGGDPALTVVAARDVRWESLGYARPPRAFDYVFNAAACWQVPLRGGGKVPAAAEVWEREEKPTARFPDVDCNPQTDSYLDTRRRLHVLYWLRGESTRGRWETRHALLDQGKLVKDVPLPVTGQSYCRLVQDKSGRFHLLSAASGASELTVHPAVSEDGTEFAGPVALALGGHTVRYSGPAIACPRAGVPSDDCIDGVFPAGRGEGEKWVYFRLRLGRTR